MPVTKKPAPKTFTLICALGALFGLYVSFKATTGIFGVDNDSIAPLLVWNGLHQHGLAFLHQWRFTPDNWLLSILPIIAAQTSLFGHHPYLSIIDGWLISVAAAGLSGVIAWQLNARRAAFIIPILLLLLGLYAQRFGFVSYAVSHNTTNLFGLLAFSACLAWLRHPRTPYLIAIFLLLTTGSISDPWMVPPYAAPICLLAAALFYINPQNLPRRQAAKLLITAAAALILFKTKCLGLLGFLVPEHFVVGNFARCQANSLILIKDLGALLNIVPLRQSNDLPGSVLSLILCAGLLAINLTPGTITTNQRLTCFLSLAAISATLMLGLFVLTNTPATQESARYLLNCLYLFIITIGILSERNWHAFGKVKKAFLCGGILLFAVANASSTYKLWAHPGLRRVDTGMQAMINFLQANHLSYGYGPYWGAQANTITVMTNNAIRIRPVFFDKTTGMLIAGDRPQTSTQWYTPADVPPAQKNYFVYVVTDNEECADKNLCTQGLTKQFGAPAQTLTYESATIMVWPHPLLTAASIPPRYTALVRTHIINREILRVCLIRKAAAFLHISPTPALNLYAAHTELLVPVETITCPEAAKK